MSFVLNVFKLVSVINYRVLYEFAMLHAFGTVLILVYDKIEM